MAVQPPPKADRPSAKAFGDGERLLLRGRFRRFMADILLGISHENSACNGLPNEDR